VAQNNMTALDLPINNMTAALTAGCSHRTASGHHEEGGSCSPSFSPLANRALVRLPPSSYDSATPGMLSPDLRASLPVDTQRPGGGRLLPLGDQICSVKTKATRGCAVYARLVAQ
jgi:hypothetical protein